MKRVIFLCTGNSARSQMAEAFLRKYGDSEFETYSAGLEPKPLNPFTVQVMQEVGIDVSGQKSKGIKMFLGTMLFSHLVTVCDDAEKNCPTVWPGVRYRLHWSFDDPAALEGSDEQKLAKFREVRELIEKQIKVFLVEQKDSQGLIKEE